MVDRYELFKEERDFYSWLGISQEGDWVKYKDYEKLKDTVINYITAKIMLTECMQNRFKQVCNGCSKYYTCKIYEAYCFAWQDLQKAAENCEGS